MDQALIESIIDVHQPTFSLLADAWFDQGATSFYITDVQDRILLYWPPITKPRISSYAADVKLDGRPIMRLHLVGAVTLTTQRRLVTDARIVSDLLQTEYELNRMTSDLIEQQDQLMALHQLAQTSTVQRGLQSTMRTLTGIMAKLLSTDIAFMALLRPPQPPICVAMPPQGWDERLWDEILALVAEKPNSGRWLLQRGEDSLTPPPTPFNNLLLSRMPIEQGRVLLLGAANKYDGNFQAPDLKLFDTIVAPAVTTVENVLLHQEMVLQARVQTEMELAHQIQMRLLPQVAPIIPGLQIAARTQPASLVGGDFFDFVDNCRGVLTFMIGDVSGKGMPAALMMAMLRTALRSKVSQLKEIAPAQLLAELNSELYQDFSDVDMFATIFVGQYDYLNHRLHYANYGHAPVIYRAKDGQPQMLEADAPPLCIVDFGMAQSHMLSFAAGDLLVVTTDGFNEAERSDGAMFGYEALLDAVNGLAHSCAGEIAQRLFAVTAAFVQGQPRSDDQTLLVLKRMPHDAQSS